jgi:hypothetical protein
MSDLDLGDELFVDAAKRKYVLMLELAPDECFTEETLVTVF